MIEDLTPLLSKFMLFAKDKLKFQRPPRLFLKKDDENGNCMLGKTAHYDPKESGITLFISKRHPKDIMRSLAHELVHHCQNERGDLSPDKMKTMSNNYAQENDHMRKMEEEAYLQGNMCFRDWEDGLDDKLKYRMHIAEHKFLKENKKMSVKITKKFLKETITKLLDKRVLSEEKSKEEMEKEIKDLEKQVEAHKDASLKSQYSEEQKANHKKNAARKEERIARLQKKIDGHKTDTKLAADVKNKTMLKHLDDDSTDEPSLVDTMKKAADKTKAAVAPQKKQVPQKESKVQTPEQENKLYESRFTDRNTKLFDKLLKEWTK